MKSTGAKDWMNRFQVSGVRPADGGRSDQFHRKRIIGNVVSFDMIALSFLTPETRHLTPQVLIQKRLDRNLILSESIKSNA